MAALTAFLSALWFPAHSSFPLIQLANGPEPLIRFGSESADEAAAGCLGVVGLGEGFAK